MALKGGERIEGCS
uniref:Uncharacterized protein n=1 Tax=Arundo donax TaxID=35708 RepID=A0A0A9BFF1_ARUDO